MFKEHKEAYTETCKEYTILGKILITIPLLILITSSLLFNGLVNIIEKVGKFLMTPLKVKKHKRLILVGGAASGKDFYRDYLREYGHLCDVSYTTRPKRENEIEGQSYVYVSEETFKMLDFYEKVNFNNWWYGTLRESWNNNQVFIMSPSAIKQLTEKDRKESLIIYFDIEENVRKIRLNKRQDTKDSVERRLKADREDFNNFQDYDIKITNPFFKCEEIIKL